MNNSKIAKGLVAAVAVIGFCIPAISSADEPKGNAEKVRYADLNVEKEAGAKILYRRLQLASKRVCGVESIVNAGGVREIKAQRHCYRDALDAAVAKIDNEMLTELHEG